MGKVKTNALRILDQQKVSYEILHYEHKDGKIDGVSVAGKIGEDEASVYKTLVAFASSASIYVFLIPVAEELDLKRAAKAVSEKKIEMLPMKDLQRLTGYIRGGCSPIGMKKQYPVFLDESAKEQDAIIVSAGKIGVQMRISVGDLLQVTGGKLVSLIQNR